MAQQLIVSFVLLLLLGCEDFDEELDDLMAVELVGRQFTSQTATQFGHTIEAVKQTEFRLSFGDDGHVAASTGCNRMIGIYNIEKGRLVLSLSQTGIGCDPAIGAQEIWYISFLDASPEIYLEDNRMLLWGSKNIKIEYQNVTLGP